MRIGIVGVAGRMGRAVVQQVTAAPGCVLAAACDRRGTTGVGLDAGILAAIGALGVIVGESPAEVFADSQVVIDFTTPAVTAHHAALAAFQQWRRAAMPAH